MVAISAAPGPAARRVVEPVAAGDAAGGVDQHDLGHGPVGARQQRLGAALLEQPVEPDAARPQADRHLGAAAGALQGGTWGGGSGICIADRGRIAAE